MTRTKLLVFSSIFLACSHTVFGMGYKGNRRCVEYKQSTGFLVELKQYIDGDIGDGEKERITQQINKLGTAICDLVDDQGNSALHVCANSSQSASADLIDLLLQKNMDPKKQNNAGETPLLLATFNGNVAAMKHLATKSTVNIADDEGITPLHAVVLIERARQNSREKKEEVYEYDIKGMLQVLLGRDANIVQGHEGVGSPLRWAFHFKFEDIITTFARFFPKECLKQAFPYKDNGTQSQYSFLQWCIGREYEKVIGACLCRDDSDDVAGIQDVIRNAVVKKDGEEQVSPIQYAVAVRQEESWKPMVQYLPLEYNENDLQNSPFHQYAVGKIKQLPRVSCNSGQLFWKKNSLGRTPLHVAAIKGEYVIMLSLLNEFDARGEGLLIHDNYSLTPWHYACALHGKESPVTKLLNERYVGFKIKEKRKKRRNLHCKRGRGGLKYNSGR